MPHPIRPDALPFAVFDGRVHPTTCTRPALDNSPPQRLELALDRPKC
ncbi:hypothetical protein SBA1_460011 [Candidatus Sulfotelmatobacter kueseliae]|uniref:Uncharacterized protein n=1 Tax=Candidatus Sulfotelmatobacter kueseliae TaxID=2042962 RepID=A0A2U3KRZ4_9BACT|nr:hypothetical protein SBA1_460011 [Candidatus Sulfotelmatobacter kueseliae]